MALFDFMGKDIGGYSGVVQAPQTGITGMTYGDLASTLMKYGSKPGSSGAMFAGAIPGKTQQPVGQLQDFGPTVQQQQKKKSADSMANVMSIFASVFGAPGLGG
jgi:hypothetical protein